MVADVSSNPNEKNKNKDAACGDMVKDLFQNDWKRLGDVLSEKFNSVSDVFENIDEAMNVIKSSLAPADPLADYADINVTICGGEITDENVSVNSMGMNMKLVVGDGNEHLSDDQKTEKSFQTWKTLNGLKSNDY